MLGMPETARASEFARLEALVTGMVQGVSYRWFTLRAASGLGLSGYVSNRGDGSVRIIAEGPRLALEELLQELRVGPAGAVVDEVQCVWAAPRHEFDRFQIRY